MIARHLFQRVKPRCLGRCLGLGLGLGLALSGGAPAQTAPDHTGLWVGQVTVNAVNEVTTPFDENNVAVARNPSDTSPTSDEAHLRILFHVDSARKVRLLRSVAILNRNLGSSETTGRADQVNPAAGLPSVTDTDLALITDPHLYSEFPAQAAIRIATPFFDFGDPGATAVVDRVVEEVAKSVAVELGGTADLKSVEFVTNQAIATATPNSVALVDVDAAFRNFLATDFPLLAVDSVANGDDGSAIQAAADALKRDALPPEIRDPRGDQMLQAVKAAIATPPAGTAAQQAARNAAAAFADLDDDYNRFLAGTTLAEMIPATVAATAGFVRGSIASYGGRTAVTSTAHGLATGESIQILGSPGGAYDGTSTVTVVDADTFTIDKAFDSAAATSGGSWADATSATSVESYAADATDAERATLISTAHGLVDGDSIQILGSPGGAYDGTSTVTLVDADTFTIGKAFDSAATSGGSWTAAQHITSFAAISDITTVRSTGHGLVDGEVIQIVGSPKADYESASTVGVIDGDTFTIDKTFDSTAATSGGFWSRISAQSIASYGADPTNAGKTTVTSTGHELADGATIEIVLSPNGTYDGTRTVTLVDANSFTIEKAFDSTAATSGGFWTGFPNRSIASYAADPADSGITRVKSTAHGLSDGQRIVITGSLAASAYDGAHAIIKVDSDTFSIDVAFDSTASGSGLWRSLESPSVTAALDEGASRAQSAYADSRFALAIDAILDAIANAAIGGTADPLTAGINALSTVPRYAGPGEGPPAGYTEFVRSDLYQDSVEVAAQAAAEAAVSLRERSLLATAADIEATARAAAVTALRDVYSAAARAKVTELPVNGSFGLGNVLSCTVFLPARHPTNPFRHRRHPDHTVGLEISRDLTLTFDTQAERDPEPADRSGYGVDFLAGDYEEEIFGLHKPLGASKDIGLKSEGRFLLRRLSRITSLNSK